MTGVTQPSPMPHMVLQIYSPVTDVVKPVKRVASPQMKQPKDNSFPLSSLSAKKPQSGQEIALDNVCDRLIMPNFCGPIPNSSAIDL